VSGKLSVFCSAKIGFDARASLQRLLSESAGFLTDLERIFSRNYFYYFFVRYFPYLISVFIGIYNIVEFKEIPISRLH